jgi:hypothetical protein
VPDYHWFYDPDVSFTVAEATDLQRRILQYFQRRVGRGALINQMWHDYAIAGHPPDHDPDGGPFLAMHEAVRDHFGSERVYAPAIAEASSKMQIAQRSRFVAQWSSDGTAVTVSLDLSRLSSGERAHLAGMGLRVNRPGAAILGVELDGAPHPAFSADTVILPAIAGASAVVRVTTGDPAAAGKPHLTYLSKAPRAAAASDGNLRVELASPGLHTRFCLVPPTRHVVIGADRYAPEGAETCGRLSFGSPGTGFEARALDAGGLSITAADRRIVAQRSTGSQVTLDVAAGRGEDRLTFRATEAPDAVRVGDRAATPVAQGAGAFTVQLGTASATTVTFDL